MIQFGTGGWRAIIADGFTKENVRLLCTALSVKMKGENVSERGIVIGYDRRFLSDVAARWAAEVFGAAGVPVKLIRREAPTPLIMFAVKEFDMPYGLAVTASHNPAVYNGIKIFTRGGRDADETVTGELEAIIGSLPPGGAADAMRYEDGVASGIITEIDPINTYIDTILRSVDLQAIRDAELRVVLDPMYGVSKTSLQTILLTARCHVDIIHERRDTLFGGRLPSPNVDTLGALRAAVLEAGAEIGIATDGDADRLGVIDETGRFLHPNDILVLLYWYLVSIKGWKGPVVRNLATTHMLDRVAASLGERCIEVPVGFKHISKAMSDNDAVLGGESSGGLTVRGHINGKDGIYAASLLIEMMAVTKRRLSEIYKEITNELGELHMAESDCKFPPERRQAIESLLMREQKLPGFRWGIERVSYMDGCKVYFQNGGWLVCRFSGTEPLLRIFCEMETAADANEAARQMKEYLSV
ncbi:MAG: phosphoglucomutase/phosphomannomutase family protein [Oscillospiraceae bacterium]|jgi:phosphomannomutase|nr:phosphoglucomutase/phosphomannomutase family protein [Oscillospiraceae bacterium]